MKITDIQIGEIFVPLATPFKTALRTVEQVEDVVFALESDDGRIGHGSAPATAPHTRRTCGCSWRQRASRR